MKTLRLGSTGDEVKLLQEKLGGLVPDGIFGRLTQAAVIAFQSANGLDPDGIVGAKTWAKLLEDKPAEPPIESEIRPPDFKQFDPAWKNIMFSNHSDPKQTIGNSGCGPTAMADVVAHWWDANITPVEMCEFAVDNGYREYEGGVSGAFFGAVADKYGASKVIRTSNIATAISCLQQGGLVIVCFGKGKWTSAGHFCLIWRYEITNPPHESTATFYINDPGSSSKSKETGTYYEVRDQAKGFWCIWR